MKRLTFRSKLFYLSRFSGLVIVIGALSGCAHQMESEQSSMQRQGALMQQSADAIAVVNGVAIKRSEFERRLRASGAGDTAEQREIVKRGLIARELIRQAAESEKLGDTDIVRTVVDDARVDAENQLYIARHGTPHAVNDADVRAQYDAIVASLGKVEYKPRIIVLASDAAVQSAIERLRRGESFHAVAASESVDASGPRGGELPWVSFRLPPAEGHTQGLPLEVARALIQLKAGEYTRSPLRVGETRMLVKLDATRPIQIPPFERVRGTLLDALQTKARDEAFSSIVDSLASKAVIIGR